MAEKEKPLIWLHAEVKSPPFSKEARIETGFYMRMLQKGMNLSLPQSRPMPSIGARCHELRINDEKMTWRIIYCLDEDAIIILEVFSKKSKHTPKKVIDICKKRMSQYDV